MLLFLAFKIFVARFLAFIIPFQLITITLGFVYLCSCLHVLKRLKTFETPIILILAFSLFAGWLHPQPLWSSRYHDEMFGMYGIRTIADHLKENIRSNDVILNLTEQVRLEGNFSFLENQFYLKQFFSKHHLERLLERTGQVGIWVILREPIKNEKLFRFEFPEKPGALLDFLNAIGTKWNISLFHYRNHGSDYGRVLCGIQVPSKKESQLTEHLSKLGYTYWEESDNPAYEMFLAR